MKTTISAEEARANFSDVVNRAAYRNEQTVVTRRGKSVAAIISMEDLELLDSLVRAIEDGIDAKALQEAVSRYEPERAISLEDAEAELGL